MFGLFKKKNEPIHQLITSYSSLGTDIHSHLLPGIDDGSPNMDTSIELILAMQSLGFNKIITTPHILFPTYKNTYEIIKEKEKEVQNELINRNINFSFKAAAEYFGDDYFLNLVKSNKPLLTIYDNWVLVEFSMAMLVANYKDILFEMQMAGYQPIIAHPERYIYLMGQKNILEALHDAGYLFQLNLMSLTGHYGKATLEMAHFLIKKNYYDLAGSDLHHIKHINTLKNSMIFEWLSKIPEGQLKNNII